MPQNPRRGVAYGCPPTGSEQEGHNNWSWESLEYAHWLRALLQKDGEHRVHVVNEPDLRLDGIVVVDEESLERLSPIFNPHRFVVFVRNRTDRIARIWEEGIRQVVFEGSTAESAHLTILAAELKLTNLDN